MGFRAFFNNERPILHPEDIKGLIWRVPKDDVLISNYEGWGVSPQPLAWHELFNAPSKKVVNGGGNPFDDIGYHHLY
jgi:TRAP-type C4-dicarboxylate transport system substrate-binding protein